MDGQFSRAIMDQEIDQNLKPLIYAAFNAPSDTARSHAQVLLSKEVRGLPDMEVFAIQDRLQQLKDADRSKDPSRAKGDPTMYILPYKGKIVDVAFQTEDHNWAVTVTKDSSALSQRDQY